MGLDGEVSDQISDEKDDVFDHRLDKDFTGSHPVAILSAPSQEP